MVKRKEKEEEEEDIIIRIKYLSSYKMNSFQNKIFIKMIFYSSRINRCCYHQKFQIFVKLQNEFSSILIFS